jgi:3-hydroxyacyl-CoA dehydrogenase
VHFFNPPRYMHLVELIACHETRADILDDLEKFLVTTLGKGVIRARDTPNFIANRVGVFSMLATIHHAQKFALGFDLVDALTGPLIGRPKSATFRTADVVGLDTFAHVVKTMTDTLPDDPWHHYYAIPGWLQSLIEQGALGQKSKRGVYQKVGRDIQVIDAASGAYKVAAAEADAGVVEILKNKDPVVRFAALHASTHPQAQFLWAIFRDTFHYCAVHLASIADNARDLDLAIRWGFGWNQGPFEWWQGAGWSAVAAWIAEDIAAGRAMSATPLPAWVLQEARGGVHTVQGSYAPASTQMVARSALPVYRRQLFPDRVLGEVGEGYNLTKEWFMEERLMIAARCLGGAERCLEDAFGYAVEREQFGERIIEFQGVSFPLAEAVSDLAAARAFTYQVAWEVTQGTLDPKTLHAKAASIKLFASEMANRVVDSCVQVLGGRGYMRENAVERFYRDLRVDRIWEGTSEIQKVVLVNEMRKRGTSPVAAWPKQA